MLVRKPLFNPEGSDELESRSLLYGNTTNLINLNSVKYKWAINLYKGMLEDFWIPQKVDLSNDKSDYFQLTKEEKRAYEGTLSFLVFLDSLQVNHIPNLSLYFTAPELAICFSVQAFQESVHSNSYQYIIESIIPVNKREGIYDLWRTEPLLYRRNKFIADIYQEFLNSPNEKQLYKVLIANYILESLYFYNGFQLFYTLNSRHLMPGTQALIKYINQDENKHVALFANILNELMPSILKIYSEDEIAEIFAEAVRQEIEWSSYIIGDSVLGISCNSIESYTKYLANKSLTRIQLPILFSSVSNPYKYLEKQADLSGNSQSKGNFFETSITSYSQSSSLKGLSSF